ncbi:hypothetical protein CVT26_009299 [Gymnopilus dilepis]|uniref:Copper transporter n=1 Tax=Gymnopilus dilepis TaxID=231916 RepID=A0A409YAB4_9AGAR|nr:hypothetical protein CVT26_009299 [Gymnopilus dilepis]
MVFRSHLHWTFESDHVLLPTIVLDSTWDFLIACILVIFICLSERFITFLLDKQWAPRMFRLSRLPLALWRTALYSAATSLRLCYMLVAMTFHAGLIAVIVSQVFILSHSFLILESQIITLSSAQFIHELSNLPKPQNLPLRNMTEPATQPLLSREEQSHPLKSFRTRPRSKSKPDEIFIHPTESNIARADAVAMEMGIAGETERVQAFLYQHEAPPWEMGKGKDIAREMLLGSHTRKRSQEQFHINSSYSDSDPE